MHYFHSTYTKHTIISATLQPPPERRESILFGSGKQISVFKINAGYRLPVLTVFRSGEDYGSIRDVITRLAACQLSVPIPSSLFFRETHPFFKYQTLSSFLPIPLFLSLGSHWLADKCLNETSTVSRVRKIIPLRVRWQRGVPGPTLHVLIWVTTEEWPIALTGEKHGHVAW